MRCRRLVCGQQAGRPRVSPQFDEKKHHRPSGDQRLLCPSGCGIRALAESIRRAKEKLAGAADTSGATLPGSDVGQTMASLLPTPTVPACDVRHVKGVDAKDGLYTHRRPPGRHPPEAYWRGDFDVAQVHSTRSRPSVGSRRHTSIPRWRRALNFLSTVACNRRQFRIPTLNAKGELVGLHSMHLRIRVLRLPLRPVTTRSIM